MPDMTMCRDTACPSARKCYRFMARGDPRYQSIFEGTREPSADKCGYYRPTFKEWEKGGRMAKKPPVKKKGKK